MTVEAVATPVVEDVYTAAGTVRTLTVFRRLGDYDPERWERTITADVEFLKNARRELEAIGTRLEASRRPRPFARGPERGSTCARS